MHSLCTSPTAALGGGGVSTEHSGATLTTAEPAPPGLRDGSPEPEPKPEPEPEPEPEP